MINPVIVRHARTQFRLERIGPIITLAAYLVVLVLAFFLTYLTGAAFGASWKESLRNYWHELLAIQVFALVVMGSLRAAGTVVREKEQKRFDFQLVTGMSPWRIAEGEMAGSTLYYYFLILCSLPFSVLCVLGGGVTWTLFGYSYLLLFTGAFFFHSWAMLASTVSKTYAGSVLVTLIVVAAFSAVVVLREHSSATLRALSVLSPFHLPFARLYPEASGGTIGFFDGIYRDFLAVSAFYFFFGMWALSAAVRKIRSAQAPYISKLQAVLFAALFLAAVSGLLVARVPRVAGTWEVLFYESTAIYLTAALLLLLVFAFVLSPSLDSYTSMVRRGTKGFWNTLFGERSLYLVNLLVIFAAGVAIYFGLFLQKAIRTPDLTEAAASGKMPLVDISMSFFFVLLAALFYSLVVQLCTFLSKRAGREIAALVLLALVMMPGLSEVWCGSPEAGFAQVFNPVAVVASMLPHGPATPGTNLSVAAIVFYFIFCTLLGTLLFLRARRVHTHAAPAAAAPPPAEAEPATPVEPEPEPQYPADGNEL